MKRPMILVCCRDFHSWRQQPQCRDDCSSASRAGCTASEQSALMQSLDAQLYVLLQEMAHSQHVIHTVQTDIVPTLETALSEANNAFEKGQLSYNQYSGVRRELLSAQTQLLEAFESLHLQHIEIQRLTGTSYLSEIFYENNKTLRH